MAKQSVPLDIDSDSECEISDLTPCDELGRPIRLHSPSLRSSSDTKIVQDIREQRQESLTGILGRRRSGTAIAADFEEQMDQPSTSGTQVASESTRSVQGEKEITEIPETPGMEKYRYRSPKSHVEISQEHTSIYDSPVTASASTSTTTTSTSSSSSTSTESDSPDLTDGGGTLKSQTTGPGVPVMGMARKKGVMGPAEKATVPARARKSPSASAATASAVRSAFATNTAPRSRTPAGTKFQQFSSVRSPGGGKGSRKEERKCFMTWTKIFLIVAITMISTFLYQLHARPKRSNLAQYKTAWIRLAEMLDGGGNFCNSKTVLACLSCGKNVVACKWNGAIEKIKSRFKKKNSVQEVNGFWSRTKNFFAMKSK